mgnify:FL=1
MKILMLGWELPPHNSGGLGVACYYLSKAIAEEGGDIDFVIPYKADYSMIDWMNIHAVTNLPASTLLNAWAYDHDEDMVGGSDDGFGDTLMRRIQREYVRYVRNFVKYHKPDVIHAHDWLTMEAGIAAKRASNAPLIVHVHATEFDRAGGGSGNPMIHEIEEAGLLMADRIIAVSERTKWLISERYHIPADKIEVVYNAINLNELTGYSYSNDTYRYVEFLRNQGYTVVSTITRFTIQKGLRYLVEATAKAIRKYDKLVFLFVGDGEQRDELISLAAHYGISNKIIFTGFVRGQAWRDSYSVSDIFVMSSVSEPFGITALEAAHHENALILTHQSGVSEVIDNALKYDFWDTNKLADQIVALALSKSLTKSLQRNVSNEYKRITWNDMAKKCIDMYKKVGNR